MVSPHSDNRNENGRVEGAASNSGTNSDSSPSSADTSPPSTPPSPEVEYLPPIEHAPHSSHLPKRSWRSKTPQSARLGAIDEDSNQVSPDIPMRDPRRNLINWNLAHSKLFGFGLHNDDRIDSKKSKKPPPNIWADVQGPRGEKFDDMRQNRRGEERTASSSRKKKFLWIGLVLFLVIVALAVGLGVGLTRRKAKQQQNNGNNGSSSSGSDNGGFPIGDWAMTTYLVSDSTSCTPESSTWTCYPYQTYNESVSGSLNSLVWSISQQASKGNNNGNNSYLISATQPTFSYPFTNISLQYSTTAGPDNNQPAYTFQTAFRKTVVPSTSITSDNTAARCYYNNTLLTVTLYTSLTKASALSSADASVTQGGADQQWPYALEYHEEMSESPECYEYINGADGTPIDLTGTASGQCNCNYANYGV